MNEDQWASHPPTGSESFYLSIRESGWFRAQPRWVAGVCSGIAVRTGWDVRLVRGLVVATSLVLVFPAALYGVAWLLLPDGPDGPIQMQRLFAAEFSVAQLGALLLILIGIAGLPAGFAWFPMSLLWLVIVGALIGLLVFLASKQTNQPADGSAETSDERYFSMNSQMPSQGRPGPQPYNQGAPSPYPGGQQRYFYPRPVDQTPVLGNLAAFVTLGVLFFIAAVGVALMFTSVHPVRVVLTTIGGIVLITGAVLAWAAYRGKRGGWFLGFSIAGAILMVPATLLGVAVAAGISYTYPQYDSSEGGTGYVEEWDESGEDFAAIEDDQDGLMGTTDLSDTNAWLDHRTSSIYASDSEVVLDLTAAPNDGQWYSISALNSDVTVLLSSEQLPVIDVSYEEDSQIVAVSRDPKITQQSLERWANTHFLKERSPLDSSSEVNLNLEANDSVIRFVFYSPKDVKNGVVPYSDPLAELSTAELEDAQSGN